MILECNTDLLLAIATDLAEEFQRYRPSMIVNDAVEGYNPVHDLCRLVVGAAIALADIDATQHEYAVVGHPRAAGATSSIELDDVEFAAKMERARRTSATLPDVEVVLSRYGEDAYRHEAFRHIVDWTVLDSHTPPEYERHGEQRVAKGRYAQVIRQRDHMLPLRDALRNLVEKRSCAF